MVCTSVGLSICAYVCLSVCLSVIYRCTDIPMLQNTRTYCKEDAKGIMQLTVGLQV
jgi:hypothetical protein